MRADTPATRQAPLADDAPHAAAMRWTSLLLIFTPLLIRATTQSTNLPDWDIDPTVLPLATPAVGPAGSMLVDAIVLLGAALGLLAQSLQRWSRTDRLLLLLAGLGAVAVIAHGWILPAGDAPPGTRGALAHQRIGAAWLSAVAAAVTLRRLCTRDDIRRIVLGLLLAFVLITVLRGMHQTLVEHPQLMRSFEANKERERVARGWSEDSPLWKSYIRRLSQADATAWFGLSNVFASFAAAGLAFGAALLAGCRQKRTPTGSPQPVRHAMLIALLATLLSAVGIWIADSKGGYALALLGLLLVGAGLAARARPAWIARLPLRWVGPIAAALVLAAVAARGVLGERMGELSLLFRWFYQQATIRIFLDHPLWGVGPGGFQNAYLTAKNPLSPEEIVSPHSIFYDYLGTLGVWGVAWIALFLVLLAGVGRSLFLPADQAELKHPRNALRAGMLTLAFATLAATWFETALTTPEAALIRVLGLGLGCMLIWALVRGPWKAGSDRLALGAGGLALALHAQIEVTASYPISAALVLAAIAAAGAPSQQAPPEHTSPAPRSGWAPRWPVLAAAAACLAISLLLLSTAGTRAWPWQRELRLAAEPARLLGTFGERLTALAANRYQPLSDGPHGPDSGDRWLADVSAQLGRTITAANSPDPAGLMRELESRLLPAAADHLSLAASIYPEDWRVARECSRMHLRVAIGNLRTNPALAAKHGELAASALRPAGLSEALASAGRLRALAVVHETLAREASQPASRAEAARLLELAFTKDPYNLDIAWRLFKIHLEQLPEGAPPDPATRQWAAKAIEIDDLSRLDRSVRALPEADRSAAERVLKSP